MSNVKAAAVTKHINGLKETIEKQKKTISNTQRTMRILRAQIQMAKE